MKRVKKGRYLFILFLLGSFQSSPALTQIETLFSPEVNFKEKLLEEMEATTSTLDVAIHEISSLEIAQALVKARQRGVKVRIITDSKQAKMRTSKITYLIQQGVLIKVLGGKERGVMNLRFAIFDEKRVLTGSFDWSDDSLRWNYENLFMIDERETVTIFQKEFEKLWREKRVIE
jgi:phosphatidylserine/phosphatidylglycerophosphate/cardiolipin synthase-like enzyme